MKKFLLLSAVFFILSMLLGCTKHVSPAPITQLDDLSNMRVTRYDMHDFTGALAAYCLVSYDASGNLYRRDMYDPSGALQEYRIHNTAGTVIDFYAADGTPTQQINQQLSGGRIIAQQQYYTGSTSPDSSSLFTLSSGNYNTSYFYDSAGNTDSMYASYIYSSGSMERIDVKSTAGSNMIQYITLDHSVPGKVTLVMHQTDGTVMPDNLIYYISAGASNVKFEDMLAMTVYYF